MSLKELSGHWKKLVSDPKFLGAADLEGGPLNIVFATI